MSDAADNPPPSLEEMSPGRVLVHRALADGPQTYDELVAATYMSKSAVKNAVYDLEAAGLVERRADPHRPNRKRIHRADSPH